MDDKTLDRELEALLAVEPSPSFRAGIRERIAAGERPHPAWRLPWIHAAAGAVALAMVGAVVLRVLAPSAPMPRIAARHIDGALHEAPVMVIPAREPGTPATRRTRPADAPLLPKGSPPVIVYAPEAAAWRRLLAGVRAGRVDATQLAGMHPMPVPEIPEEFGLPPIVIEPLTPAALDQGVHP
jgi:hypothetical protein